MQLLSQIVKLSYFPQIKVIHTSKTFYQQIYIPSANWLLMTGTIVVTVAYSDVSREARRPRLEVLLLIRLSAIDY